MRAVDVTGPVAFHGEGPVFSEAWGGLRFVDLLAGDLLTLHDDGSVSRLGVGSPVAGFVRPRSNGGYVVATERGISLSDDPHGEPTQAITLWDDAAVRMNDGGTDPFGRLYAGSMAYDESPGAARLLRIDADLAVTTILPSVTISNGIAFSPDGALCYYVDTPTNRIDVFDHVDGELVDRRPFVAIDPADGHPDGLTVAADGSVWLGLWAGSAVRGYDADGTLRETIGLPASNVTACAFGGDGLRTLYITTSRSGLADAASEPAAGSLFAAEPGVAGLPVVPFAG